MIELPDLSSVTRFEVIDHAGPRASYSPEQARSVVAYDVSVELSLQDDGRTLKVFLGTRAGAKACSNAANLPGVRL